MKLTKAQANQLNDMVTQTRITRGKNAGERKDALVDINHFDMRSFNKLISEKLVAPSEYNGNEWYATEKGYAFWLQAKSAK
ncbi:hypothetical protein D051_1079 [Vibrio parahaemolyticus VPCR-2010]|uniref:hypothetical protein n=1 Tax=Vibrio parahaemolyticus TaxID=670 RepID=UPI00038E6400|nr:hypothetical protein D051_1079 [Vibrio parahaemolyticus VPCR-2010]